jgi:hypothetical protein
VKCFPSFSASISPTLKSKDFFHMLGVSALFSIQKLYWGFVIGLEVEHSQFKFVSITRNKFLGICPPAILPTEGIMPPKPRTLKEFKI